MSYSALLAMASMNSALDINTNTGQRTVSLMGSVMTFLPVVTSDKIHITSDSPLQLVYFKHGSGQRFSVLALVPSVDDICQTGPIFDSGDMREQQDNSANRGDLKSGVQFSQSSNLPQQPGDTDPSLPQTDTDARHLSKTPEYHEQTTCSSV